MEVESAKSKRDQEPPVKTRMADDKKIRRNPSTDQKKVRRAMQKKADLSTAPFASIEDPTDIRPLHVRVAQAILASKTGGYMDRKGDGVLCDDCGAKRWGPTGADTTEGQDQAAFDARYNDPSGDWVWDRVIGAPCDECGKRA